MKCSFTFPLKNAQLSRPIHQRQAQPLDVRMPVEQQAFDSGNLGVTSLDLALPLGVALW
ncbi:MAG: hypothetical protein IT165_15650 [Bryobacterales bacterium]|nr:hypothetical protein [Bryobacterales bacterium]